jgi:hypothetical protein
MISNSIWIIISQKPVEIELIRCRKLGSKETRTKHGNSTREGMSEYHASAFPVGDAERLGKVTLQASNTSRPLQK